MTAAIRSGLPHKAFLPFAAFPFAFAGLAHAAAPVQKTQVPCYYRMMVGSFEVTALDDGYIDLESALLKNTTPREVQGLLARMFVKGPKVQTAVNAYLINTGKQLALITHLHGDHVNGLVTADGMPVFANAEVWLAQADTDFWLDAEVAAKAPKDAQPFFKMAQDAAVPYQKAGRWKTFKAEQQVVPGIASVAAPGHTPGHSGYLVSSGGQKLLIWGDIVHNHAVQFVRPQVASSSTSTRSRRWPRARRCSPAWRRRG